MATTPAEFSVAVIGLGMMGSAACRHLSLATGEKVVGIGPAEPQDWKSHTGVFASHYDEGRLTRIVDKDPIWSLLAARSIERYRLLERESGIQFHYPVGSVRVSPFFEVVGDSTAEALDVGRHNGAEVELLRGMSVLKKRFPYFGFEEGDVGLMEDGGAGYINPSAMVQAQLTLAAKQGVLLVRETVVSLERTPNGVRIVTDSGRTLVATRVLISADVYTKFLVKKPKLVTRTVPESILLAEVGPEEERRLQGMPSLIWRLKEHKQLHSVYACPPIRYPNGKTYVKIGGSYHQEPTLSTHEEIVEWFHSDGHEGEVEILLGVLKKLVPGLAVESVDRKSCINTYTAHNYPYIDAVDGKRHEEAQFFVVTGGNGASAKSSDEIGRIAALLVEHRCWTYDLEAFNFKTVFEET
ncbi:unnamed protein product [Calypogeia fissa]